MGEGNKKTSKSRQTRIIERPRLIAMLDRSHTKTLLITAPAGYGKSTLLQQWTSGSHLRPLTLKPRDADVASLAQTIARHIDPLSPGFATHVEAIVASAKNPSKDVDRIITAFVGADLTALAERVVIDDYHVIASTPAAENLLEGLALESSLDFLLSSRIRPQWVTTRQLLYGSIEEINARSLALTAVESSEVLDGKAYSEQLAAIADGWPAVIALAAKAPTIERFPEDANMLYDFLAEEIFDRCQRDVQESLLQLALLPTLDDSFISRLFGRHADSMMSQVSSTGLVTEHAHGPEMHPLARDFLLNKLSQTSDGADRARSSATLDLHHSRWDNAFELIMKFRLHDQLGTLLEESFEPLSSQGRIATIEIFAKAAATHGLPTPGLLELAEAEVALRDGVPRLARASAIVSARRLPGHHRLRARAWLVAGSAALQEHDLDHALALHERALETADTQRTRVEALWGKCLSLIHLEDSSFSETLAELEDVALDAPHDRMRFWTVNMQSRRLVGGLGDLNGIGRMVELEEEVNDPRARTSFRNTLGYLLGLQGRYTEAKDFLLPALDDTLRFQLNFAQGHLNWTLAFSELGLRMFSASERRLEASEEVAFESNDRLLELNCRALRARLFLAQRRPDDALKAVRDNWEEFPTSSMYGEYLGTRALVYSVLQDRSQSLVAIRMVEKISRVAEARAFVSASKAILALTQSNVTLKKACVETWATCNSMNVWDPLIIAMRAEPRLLEVLLREPHRRAKLTALLEESHDRSLMKAFGLLDQLPFSRSAATLTPRELEVFDLLCQGFRDKQIASTLFISQATVKLHIRHVLEKLGARTRAEAAARASDLTLGRD